MRCGKGTPRLNRVRSLTWDIGDEFSPHAQFRVHSGIAVDFADPHSPSQRGANEDTNGLLRQHFPEGTDLSRCDLEDLLAVQAAVNSRPGRSSTRRPPLKSWTSN